MACNKKEPQAAGSRGAGVRTAEPPVCGKEIVADVPVKAGETGIMLPVGTKLCVTDDNLEVRVQLPEGFSFRAKEDRTLQKPLPVFVIPEATYACYCSNLNSACNVFYADGMGFGCLQSSCSRSCTGKFTYKGYSVDRVLATLNDEHFFELPEVRQAAAEVFLEEGYAKLSMYRVSFYVVSDEKAFLAKASCDCEGTQACKLKTIFLPLLKGEPAARKIYFCTGSCNGCELTVS